MQEIAQLPIVLVAYYATFGIMAVGFGMMLGGTDRASAAGNFFFARPLRAVLAWSRTALVTVWTAVIGRIAGWIMNEIKEVAKDIRWLVTRERGWVRRR